MSSGGKGSSANKSKYVYGTVAGGICWGPLDWLRGIVYNGGYLWQGSLTLTEDVTDLTGSIADPLYIARGGFLKLHRGTETQPRGYAFSSHPPYRGTAWLEAKHLLFGQDTGSAPNLQVIGGRIPRVPTSIVEAADNVADDDQVNPVAAFAEILLDERGGDIPEEVFDGDSWRAAAHWAYLNRDVIFCSPLINEQSALREIAKRLLDPFNGFCRWTNSGQLACKIYEWGVDPGGLPVLDARHLRAKMPMMFGDWSDVPTEYVVEFTNRDFEYQEDAVKIPDERAAQIRQVTDQRRVSLRDVTRRSQASRLGTERRRRVAAAPTSAKLEAPRAFVDALNVGDKIKIDVDPEPGGSGLSQLARVERIRNDASDVAQLEVMTDNLAPATPYNLTDDPTPPPDDTSAPMAHFLAVPLPPAAFGWPLSVAILATRPNRSVWGMDVFFSDDTASHPFDQLGTQYDFACRAQLAASITSGATTINLTELDGSAGPEATLAANTPGGNATAAKNDTLLVLLAQLDVNGRIALDGSGDPIMEFVSIVDRSPVSGDTYAYSVLRGRLDTPARDWTSGAVAWIVPRGNLMEWESTLLGTLAGQVAYFRLVSFTHATVDDTTPIPECSVNMIPTTAPMYQRGLQGQNTASAFIYQRAASAPAVPSVDALYTFATGAITGLNNGWSATIPSGTDPLWVTIAPASAVGPTDVITPSEWPAPHILAQNGADGADGGAGANNATVFLYKRAATSPTRPSTTSTYTFATGVLTGHNNGWTQSIPDTDGNPCWAIAATASSPGPTDTIAPAEWATPTKLVQDGASGAAGLNSSSIFIYKRSASAPSLPTADTTYTFATGVLSGLNNGWTQAIPGGTDPLYVSTATAISAGSTDTILSSEWAAAQILAQNGADGSGASPAPDPDITSSLGDPYNIYIDAPSGAPSGYGVQYVQGSGATLTAYSFPFPIGMSSGSQRLKIWGIAPGFSIGYLNDTSWNDMNV